MVNLLRSKKRVGPVASWSCVVVVFVFTCGAAPGHSAETESTVKKVVVKNAVELSVEVPAKSLVGESLWVKVTVTNRGTQPILYFDPLGPYCHWTVKSPDGRLVTATRFGEQLRTRLQEGGRLSSRPLPVGKAISASVDLSRLVDLSIAGAYQGTLVIEINPGLQTPAEFVLQIDGLPVTVANRPFFRSVP